jgi:hypothetical protein
MPYLVTMPIYAPWSQTFGLDDGYGDVEVQFSAFAAMPSVAVQVVEAAWQVVRPKAGRPMLSWSTGAVTACTNLGGPVMPEQTNASAGSSTAGRVCQAVLRVRFTITGRP